MIPQLSADIRDILHAVRNVAVDFLAIVPSPLQWIFQLHTFSTGERARVRGKAVKDFCSRIRENSDICHETLPKSHDFGYEKLPFPSTKNP